jgi:hypothetical protein
VPLVVLLRRANAVRRGATSAPHEADVHAEASVFAATLQAHEGSIADGRPLWVLAFAVDANLRELAAIGARARLIVSSPSANVKESE